MEDFHFPPRQFRFPRRCGVKVLEVHRSALRRVTAVRTLGRTQTVCASVPVKARRVTAVGTLGRASVPVKARRVTVVGTLGRASVVSKVTASVVSKVTAFVVSKVTAFVVSKVTASVGFNGDRRTTVRPYNRYSSSFDTTDAQPLHVSSFGDGLPLARHFPCVHTKGPSSHKLAGSPHTSVR